MHLGWEWSSSYRKDSFSENVLSAHWGRRSGLKKAAVVLPFLKCGVLGGGRGVYFTNTPSTSSASAIHICQRQAGWLCNASPLASMNQGYFHQHFIKTKAMLPPYCQIPEKRCGLRRVVMPERMRVGERTVLHFVSYIHKLCLMPGPQAQHYTSATCPKAQAIHLCEIIFFSPSTESSGLSLVRERMLTLSHTET